MRHAGSRLPLWAWRVHLLAPCVKRHQMCRASGVSSACALSVKRAQAVKGVGHQTTEKPYEASAFGGNFAWTAEELGWLELGERATECAAVTLELYDAGPGFSVLNGCFAALGLPLALHAEVSCRGRTWVFSSDGVRNTSQALGAESRPPPLERVVLGVTRLTEPEVCSCVRALADDWRGGSYSLLRRNCVAFARAASGALLGQDGVPPRADRLAGQLYALVGDVDGAARSLAFRAGRLVGSLDRAAARARRATGP